MARTTRASDAGQIEKRNFKGEKRRKSGERCGQVSREIDWPTKISNSIERRNYVHVRFLHNRVVKPEIERTVGENFQVSRFCPKRGIVELYRDFSLSRLQVSSDENR